MAKKSVAKEMVEGMIPKRKGTTKELLDVFKPPKIRKKMFR